MNILFALYSDFSCGSASQVHALANCLADLGHGCAIAVPFDKDLVSTLGEARYTAVTFEEALHGAPGFPNGGGPDVIHGWTPREVVREFCQAMYRQHACRIFVHMQDHEWHLLACELGLPFCQMASMHDEELDRVLRPHLCHPRKAFQFMSEADGITVAIAALRELIPRDIPSLELLPSADPNLSKPLPKSRYSREMLGIPENSAVIVYHGNLHASDVQEIRSLYLAAAVLSREGLPTTLVHAGRKLCSLFGEQDGWARACSIELGLVPHEEVPALLALADVLVQPGQEDLLNNYRVPNTLPEFLSAARPVVIPNMNIATRMTHGRHAYILRRANAVAIAEAVKDILTVSGLRERLASGALEFSAEQLSSAKIARRLQDFYKNPSAAAGSSHPLHTSAESAIP